MNKRKVLDFNINLNQNQIRILLITIIILVIILLFRKQFSTTLEKIIVFTIIFILLLIISKNIIVTIIGTSLIFLLINLIIQYRNTIENFENVDEKEKDKKKDDKDDKDDKDENKLNLDANIFNSPDYLSAKGGLEKLVKQLDGGIKLSDSDTKETPKLDIDSTKYSKNNNNALQKAQIESYELINTIKTLQDTLQTLSPVLGEGKKLMSAFESLQF